MLRIHYLPSCKGSRLGAPLRYRASLQPTCVQQPPVMLWSLQGFSWPGNCSPLQHHLRGSVHVAKNGVANRGQHRSTTLASVRASIHPMLTLEQTDPLCRLSRERALRFAILMDAIRCLAGTPGGRSRDRLVLARRAEIWVRRRDARWPFSFDNVCDALNIDTERMRSYLLNPASGLVTQRQSPRVATHSTQLSTADRTARQAQ